MWKCPCFAVIESSFLLKSFIVLFVVLPVYRVGLEMVTSQCSTTSDCIKDGIFMECYDSVPWKKNATDFCECSSWYGFVGEKCDETSVQVVYLRSSLIITIIWTSLLCLLLLKDIIKYLRFKAPRLKCLKKSRRSGSKHLGLDPVFVTA